MSSSFVVRAARCYQAWDRDTSHSLHLFLEYSANHVDFEEKDDTKWSFYITRYLVNAFMILITIEYSLYSK